MKKFPKSLLASSVFVVLTPLLLYSASDMLSGALRYIGSRQQADGSWSAATGGKSDAEAASWAVKVLAMNGMDKERVDRGVEFILRQQESNGSWNNDALQTAFAMTALAEARQGRAAIEKAGDYLRRVQDRSGGFRRSGAAGPLPTTDTAVVLNALQAAGYAKKDAMVSQAILWLTSCQNPDGGYGPAKDRPSNSVSTAWAIIALSAYDFVPLLPEVKGAADWLLTAQKQSGGFAAAPPGDEDPETTAYAVMALGRLPDQRRQVSLAIKYLSAFQQPDGSFADRRGGDQTKLTCLIAWALSSMQ